MFEGEIVSINIAAAAGDRMVAVDRVTAVPGRGLEGDRYFSGTGAYSAKAGPVREVTLIEEEAVEALARDHGYSIVPADLRRNLVTRGVPLTHLVGKMSGRMRVPITVVPGSLTDEQIAALS